MDSNILSIYNSQSMAAQGDFGRILTDKSTLAPLNLPVVNDPLMPQDIFTPSDEQDSLMNDINRLRNRGMVYLYPDQMKKNNNFLTFSQCKKPILLKGTSKDDKIAINEDKDGNLTVSINGVKTKYTKEEAKRLTIDAGDGNDVIMTGKNVKTSLALYGGKGNDVIYGGKGDDVLAGNEGNDIIHAGTGNDKVWGNDGDDRIEGQGGNDYISGGKGKDSIHGSKGRDVIYGNEGDDNIHGGQDEDFINGGKGNDKIFGGSNVDIIVDFSGKNTIDGGLGRDRISITDKSKMVNAERDAVFTQNRKKDIDKLIKNIKVSGANEFKERMYEDLEFIASTKSGAKLISELAKTGKSITINYGYEPMHSSNDDKSSLIDMNDSYTYFDKKSAGIPVNVLFHELVHAYNNLTGSYMSGAIAGLDEKGEYKEVRCSEIQAVGFNSTLINALKNTPFAPKAIINPEGLTENSFNAEIGLPLRTAY